MWETYAEGYPLRKDFPLRGRFSRAEQVRQAVGANPEAHYSMEELSIAEAYDELPADMKERLRRGERGKLPTPNEQAHRRARAGDPRPGRPGSAGPRAARCRGRSR